MTKSCDKKPILCSACLLGVKCAYDGEIHLKESVLKLLGKENLIPVCPEQLGGLTTPRIESEIQGGDKVVNKKGEDVTEQFKRGAEETLKIAKLLNVEKAILKQRSPSCGGGQIYDGSFSKKVISGDGFTTRLLKENGIEVISEEDL
jgi:uncharacterized protein YbbK (DUF523 family)